MKPESFMILANCSVASMNFSTASLSLISFGMMKPLQRILKLLCIRLRSFVVFVRNSQHRWFRKGRSLKCRSKLRLRKLMSSFWSSGL